nr:hypothetical protein [Tanacetum cinerariifolium]
MQTQTSNTLHNAIMEAGSKDRPPMLAPDWKEKQVLDFDGNLTTTTERVFETYKNVKQDIRDQLNAEAEAVQIILTRIDNDIYSTVDACPNAYETWKAIERLKQGESINVQDLETNLYWEFRKFTSQDGESLESYYSRFYNMMNELIRNQRKVTNHQVNVQFLLQLQPEWQSFVTLVKQNQELKTVSYHKLYDILKQHQHEVNEIRAEKIACVANPLELVAQQQPLNFIKHQAKEYQLADLFTKALPEERFLYLVRRLGGSLLQPPSTKIKCTQIESRANKRSIINLIGHNVKIHLLSIIKFTGCNKRVLRSFLKNLPEHPSDTKVFTMKMEILLEPTSNELLVVMRTSKHGESNTYVLEDPKL